MQVFALVFTGVASLGLFGGFGLEAWRFRKYRNWQYLNTDLVLLFLLAGLCLIGSGVASMWDTASGATQYGRKGIWIGFSAFMCTVCSWLLKGWFKNRRRKGVTREELDTSIIHDSAVPLSDDEEGGDNNLQGSGEDNEFEIVQNELLDDSDNLKVEGTDEDSAKDILIDENVTAESDNNEAEEVSPELQVEAQ